MAEQWPIETSQASTVPLINVTCASGGGGAISGLSFGTDQFDDPGIGVYGESDGAPGVQGSSQWAQGVYGGSQSGPGVMGVSDTGDGVYGTTASKEHAGVAAINDSGGTTAYGVWARGSPAGYFETDTDWDAVHAVTASQNHAAVSATNTSYGSGIVPSGYAVVAYSNATAIWAQGNPAGYFQGDIYAKGFLYCDKDVHVEGDLLLINSSSGDIAEDFDLEDGSANAEPGTVLVIHSSGKLSACTEPYDTRVAGVVSGAGNLRAAIVLQRLQDRPDRSPLALVGKALCKVDAAFGGVAAGDLLTTSATPGHAMRVADRIKAVGAILGKALHPLGAGRGLVPILVSLR